MNYKKYKLFPNKGVIFKLQLNRVSPEDISINQCNISCWSLHFQNSAGTMGVSRSVSQGPHILFEEKYLCAGNNSKQHKSVSLGIKLYWL